MQGIVCYCAQEVPIKGKGGVLFGPLGVRENPKGNEKRAGVSAIIPVVG